MSEKKSIKSKEKMIKHLPTKRLNIQRARHVQSSLNYVHMQDQLPNSKFWRSFKDTYIKCKDHD